MRRVLVTRPEPGAGSTARRLRAMGYEPVLLPLTEIRGLATAAHPVGPWDAVVITSANAIRHAPAALVGALASVPAYAVGEATAGAARAAGLSDVIAGRGDAAALAALVDLPPGSRLLYLCGRVRRPDFETALAARRIDVIPLETYDTQAVPIADATASTLGLIDAVAIHSAEGATALARLVVRPAFAEVLGGSVLVAISARAAKPVAGAFADRIVVAPEPSDAAMVEALRTVTAPQCHPFHPIQ